MRPTIIAGNWKMNLDIEGTKNLLQGILAGVGSSLRAGTKAIVCPPFTSLTTAAEMLRGTPVMLGAQNMSQHDSGAYTGEISQEMLRSAGCTYVIIGHSERRQYYHETDSLVCAKVKKALAGGLVPIVCVGETLEERESGVTAKVIARQVRAGLDGIAAEEVRGIVMAYEPVWAIGTGKTATPDQAQEVHHQIRGLLSSTFGREVSETVPLQYGGSVKPENAGELLSCPDIDGALVGGACLKASSFLGILTAVHR